MRVLLAALAVVVLSGLIVTVLVKNALKIAEDLSQSMTQITYQDNKGPYIDGIVILAGYGQSTAPLRLSEKCTCQRKFYNASNDKICQTFELYYEPSLQRQSFNSRGAMLPLMTAAPMDWKNNERVVLECNVNSTYSPMLLGMILPISLNYMLGLITEGIRTNDTSLVTKFYEENFITRPIPYALAGFYNKRILERSVIKPLGAEEEVHIRVQTSHTQTGDSNYTQIEFVWANGLITKVAEIRTGNKWKIVSLVSTFILGAERCLAFSLRVFNYHKNQSFRA